MSKENNYPASRPDEHNPEWTSEDSRLARPAPEVIADVFGAPAAEQIRRGWGLRRKPDKMGNQTLRLDTDVVEAFRQEGSGLQSRINEVLRAHMPRREK